MSQHNPELEAPQVPAPNEAIQPNAPDFVETPDLAPSSEYEPLPVWVFLVCGFCLFMAGSSFAGFGSFGLGLLDAGPGGPALASNKGEQVAAATDPMSLGKKVFSNNCASCHHDTGEGEPGKYPPMDGSEWVLGSKARLAAIVLHGLSGPVTVKGGAYGAGGLQMAAWNGTLSNDQIADVLTYIRGTWGNTAGAVDPAEVAADRTKTASQAAAYNEADLMKMAPTDPTDKKP